MAKLVDLDGLAYFYSKIKAMLADKLGKNDVATVATSGSYNDLSDKPTIPSAYTLPTASSTVMGGVKIGSNISASDGTISLNKSNVTSALGYTPPTSDTVYNNATTTTAGLMSVSDKVKLNNIADNANNYIHPPTHPASMITGLADVAKSGSYNDLADKPTIPASATVDSELSSTSVNPVQNKVINAALNSKADSSALSAYLPLSGGACTGSVSAPNFQTGADASSFFQCQRFRGEGNADTYYHAVDFGYSGHDSVDFYEYSASWNFYQCTTGTKSGAVLVGNINGNGWNGGARLTGAPTAPTATAGTNTTQIATTAFVQTAVSGKANTSDLADFVTTSGQNTWRALQTFNLATLGYEQYTTPNSSTSSVSPSTSAASYYATGAFTLNLSTLSALLGSNQSTVFTAYITAGGDYALSITNGGTVKYIGEASDVAITSAGLLLNILMTKDNSGTLTSIVQASKLS
nr:MAG TPA_asm: Baseplate wedge protein [Caudoviricetes sp.]